MLTAQYWLEVLRKSSTKSEFVLSVFVILVLSLMVFALPPLLLDILIAINIIVSIALLFLAVGVRNPLELSTFPTLILLTTLFRLSLNIASSKQILLVGDAGHIIETFGRLVVGGSLLIGGVIFIIISLVQFIVVAKGAERVAEVSARFTLDGMPGKQMSIDADLRAGAVTKEEAKRRRTELERESQFHGAMDGAMKFVKGDAIAAMVIAAINVIAGMLVGTVVHDLDFAEALSKYSVLSIGDGMVSQIPSLLSAIGAGILVTRVGEPESNSALKADRDAGLAGRIAMQVFTQPKTLLYAGVSSLAFALVPGFPWYVFLAAGVALFFAGIRRASKQQRAQSDFSIPISAFEREGSKGLEVPYVITSKGAMSSSLLVEINPDLLQSLKRDSIEEEIEQLKSDVHAKLGMMFPGFGLFPNPQLPSGSFRVCVHDIAGKQFVVDGSYCTVNIAFNTAMLPWQAERYNNFLSNVTWKTGLAPALDEVGDQIMNPEKFIRHVVFGQVCLRGAELIGFQEAQDWLNRAMEQYSDLANEFLRSVSVQRLADVMRLLAADRLPLRNPRLIIESILVHAPREKESTGLAEQVRIALGRSIYSGMRGDDEKFRIALIEHSVEELLCATAGDDHDLEQIIADPTWDAASNEIVAQYKRYSVSEKSPTLVVNGAIRRLMQSYLRLKGLSLQVMSKAEVPDEAEFEAELMLCKELGLTNSLNPGNA
jgi:type III secretion protein V